MCLIVVFYKERCILFYIRLKYLQVIKQNLYDNIKKCKCILSIHFYSFPQAFENFNPLKKKYFECYKILFIKSFSSYMPKF